MTVNRENIPVWMKCNAKKMSPVFRNRIDKLARLLKAWMGAGGRAADPVLLKDRLRKSIDPVSLLEVRTKERIVDASDKVRN